MPFTGRIMTVTNVNLRPVVFNGREFLNYSPGSVYSYRNAFAGLIDAALMAWILTASIVTNRVIITDSTYSPGPGLVLYA